MKRLFQETRGFIPFMAFLTFLIGIGLWNEAGPVQSTVYMAVMTATTIFCCAVIMWGGGLTS